MWYEVQGRKVLEALITDLHSRGYSSLTIRENGDIRMKVRGDRMHDIAKQERMTFQSINRALAATYPTVISVLWG